MTNVTDKPDTDINITVILPTNGRPQTTNLQACDIAIAAIRTQVTSNMYLLIALLMLCAVIMASGRNNNKGSKF